MNDETLEIFLHGMGTPQVLPARSSDTLQAFLSAAGALPEQGQFVFVGEAADADVEAEEDAHSPADLTKTLADLGIIRRGHVHTRAVRRVLVTVHFNTDVKRLFSPAATIARVTAWAKRKLGLDPAAGADLVLALKPSGEQPRPDQHLGELLPAGAHAIEFDLVREVTPQG